MSTTPTTPLLTDFLPTTRKEMQLRGWEQADVILLSADAYVDHPSFGAAVIGRLLEAEGLRVTIIPQPDWHGDFRDFKKLGRPRLRRHDASAARMPTAPMDATTCVRNTPPSYTHKS